MNLKKLGLFVVALFAVSTLAFAIGAAPPLTNWSAPPTYTPAGKHLLAGEIGSGPFAFFPITPCRQYNSSGTPLTSGVDRTITLTGAPCGIPTSTLAVSVNITIFNISGAGGNGVVKIGTAAAPTTAWINYPSTETQRANAGAVPLNNSGQIVIQIAQGGGTADIIVDVNGYYYNGNQYMMPVSDFFSIWGNYSGGGVLFGRNDQPTAANSFGIRGWAASTGAGSAGVSGELTASGTGNDTAGVRGRDGVGPAASGGLIGSGGVRGEGKNGVIGIVATSTAEIGAVVGLGLSNTGSINTFGILGYTTFGVYSIGNLGASGTKSFIEPHPTDARKVIDYVSLEGPEAGTYFRGSGRTVNGLATINVPEDFRIVTDDDGLTVQVTPVGASATMYIVSEDLNSIVVRSSRDVKFHYLVNGVRRAYKDHQAIVDGDEYMPMSPTFRMPDTFSAEAKRRLIANGTYNEDGTVNMATAEKVGWAKTWAVKEEARAKALAAHRVEEAQHPQH
ncbi:MAG: hypothetical protein ABJC07_11980 [Acidobacteriota bacterium]